MRNSKDTIADTPVEEDILGINREESAQKPASQDKTHPTSTIDHDPDIDLLKKITGEFPDWLVEGWIKGQPCREIAQKNKKPIEAVYGLLKNLQKAIIKEIGIESHGKKNNI